MAQLKTKQTLPGEGKPNDLEAITDLQARLDAAEARNAELVEALKRIQAHSESNAYGSDHVACYACRDTSTAAEKALAQQGGESAAQIQYCTADRCHRNIARDGECGPFCRNRP